MSTDSRSTTGRRQRPSSAGRPASRRSSRSRQLKTTYDINSDEKDPDDVLLSSYYDRKYTPFELSEAHAFFRQLADHNQGGAPASYLNKRQFHTRMHKVLPHVDQECRELLRHFLDKDNDEYIDEAEFVAGCESLLRPASLPSCLWKATPRPAR